MLGSAVLATIPLVLVLGGVLYFPRAASAWPVVDAVAQTISLLIAYRLVVAGNIASAAVLVGLAVAVAAGHVTNLNPKSPTWAYIDGADLGLWFAMVLSGVIGGAGKEGVMDFPLQFFDTGALAEKAGLSMRKGEPQPSARASHPQTVGRVRGGVGVQRFMKLTGPWSEKRQAAPQ